MKNLFRTLFIFVLLLELNYLPSLANEGIGVKNDNHSQVTFNFYYDESNSFGGEENLNPENPIYSIENDNVLQEAKEKEHTLEAIEFHREETIIAGENTFALSPLFKIMIEKTEKTLSSITSKKFDNFIYLNPYDQKTYRQYSDGFQDKYIAIDHYQSVIIGSNNLATAISPSIKFIDKNTNYDQSGTTYILKNNNSSIALGTYSSSLSTENALGVVISSEVKKLPVGELIIGGALYNEYIPQNNNQIKNFGLFNQFRHKKFKFNTQVSSSNTFDNPNSKGTSLYLSPELDLTDSISIKSALTSDSDTKQAKQDFSLNIHPKNSNRNLEFEMTLTNFSRPQESNFEQRIKFSTKFKI